MYRAQPADLPRLQQAMTGLRLLLALLIAMHGWSRLLSGGYAPFGEFLTAQGFPLGLQIAISITAFEILGSLLLAWGRLILPLCAGFVFIYIMGIVLVHWPHGWFVVGAGRNGMEYSVLLIAGLIAQAWQQWPRRG